MALKYEAVTGFAALKAALEALPERVQKNVLRTALFRGAQMVRDTAKRNLQSVGGVRTGRLLKDIKAVRGKSTDKEVVANVLGGTRGGKRSAWYGHLVEKGHLVKRATGFKARGKNSKAFNKTTSGPATQIVKKTETVKGASHVPARPFLVPALESNKEDVKQEILRGLKEEIAKAVSKIK